MVDYQFLRATHITGAVLLLGNVTVTGFWSGYLYRYWKAGALPIRPIARAILWTDLVFTIGGGAILTVTGVMMALQSGFPLLGTPWIVKGIAGLGLSTLCWLVFLVPDQFRLERSTDPVVLRRAFTRWTVIGWISTVFLYYGLWAMATRR
jgi:uncharacterized membrane protein